VVRQLEDPALWSDPEKAQSLGRERVQLETVLNDFKQLEQQLLDAREFLDLAVAEDDRGTFNEVVVEIAAIERKVAGLEFARMFSGKTDQNNAYLDIQSGSGGTEAQDWAEMLLRMYLRWGDKHNFRTEIMEASAGEERYHQF
jgi:peptide chain release factor 2